MTTKNFKASALRTITSPSNPEVTTYYVWVDFRDLPSDFSLEVNPRKPKMNTLVAKQIIKAVIEPELIDFDINNRGIVVTAKSLNFNTSSKNVTLDLCDDESRYGILDGGHTYTAIIQNRDKMAENITKYVRLEVVIGETLDVTALADARNTSAQVSDIALFELEDKFDVVKHAIKGESYAGNVAYKDNELDKDIPIGDLLKLLFMFNLERYPNDSDAPVSAYSGKAAVFRDYKKRLESGDSIYDSLSKQLPLLVELYEKIQVDLPDRYHEFKGQDGTKGKFGNVRGVGKMGAFSTDFTEKRMPYQIPGGFLLPIFGAFRALITTKNDAFVWEFDPLEVWKKAGLRLVQNTFDTDTNPQQAGKNKTLWQANYRIVDSVRKDLLLEKFMTLDK